MNAKETKVSKEIKVDKKKRTGIKLFVVLVVLFIMTTIMVYMSSPTTIFVRAATAIIPYPALRVDGTSVKMKDYLAEYDALVNYFETSEEEGVEVPPEANTREIIVDTIINKVAIKKLAKKHKIKIDQKKVEEFYQDIVAGEESEEAFKKQIKETFGWSSKEFKERIVESIVLAIQMGEYVFENEDIQAPQKKLADDSHARVKAGEDFGAVAKEVHSKSKLILESDLGFLKLSEIPEDWKVGVKDLQTGEYSDVVELDEGYAQFMALDRIVAGEDVQMHLMTITVPKKTLEDVVDEYLKSVKIKRYLK